MNKSCPICVANYTSTLRKEIKCKYCDKSACTSCCEKYLLETVREPHCMHCNKGWLREFLVDNFSKVFVNSRLKKHREDILLQREKSLLPQTMGVVEERRRQKRIKELEKVERNLSYKLLNSIEPIEYDELILLNQHRVELLELQGLNPIEKEESKEKRVFTFPCPMKECRGFLSTQWKCGLCNAKICSKCHTEDLDPHTCNSDEVASAELIKKECRRCPNCGVNVFRYEGCPQMWCTNCHIGFNWHTLKIEKGPIHNPHYYEWVRTTRSTNLDALPLNACGQQVLATQVSKKLLPLHRCITEISTVQLRNLQRIINDGDQKRETYRVRYLLNEVTEKRWKQMLEQQDKQILWAQELIDLLTMFTTVATDYIVRTRKESGISTREKSGLYKEVESLREYVNGRIENINRIYNTKFELMDEKFIFRRELLPTPTSKLITREPAIPEEEEEEVREEVREVGREVGEKKRKEKIPGLNFDELPDDFDPLDL